MPVSTSKKPIFKKFLQVSATIKYGMDKNDLVTNLINNSARTLMNFKIVIIHRKPFQFGQTMTSMGVMAERTAFAIHL